MARRQIGKRILRRENMKTMEELTASALTAASAQPTKEKPRNIKVWAEWFKMQTHNDPQVEQMILRGAEFASAFKEGKQPRWMTLLGPSGIGKTHCARRLWNHLASRLNWREVEFIQREIKWGEFVSRLRAGNAFEDFRDMMTWPVLFLDDIGVERDTTGFATEQLTVLLGCRENKW